MKPEIQQFCIEPSVLLADSESEIAIRALDGRMMFFDDVTYDVQIIPTEESDVPSDEAMTLFGPDNNRVTYQIKPQNGVLRLKHFFAGEQQWTIHISTKEYESHLDKALFDGWAPHWNTIRKQGERGVNLSVYSVQKDLYTKRVLRGDLHTHTNYTDAEDSPALVAGEYRRAGYDFVAITDHNLYNIGRYAREKFGFKTDFQILTAEEVHNGYNGQLHVLNIGGRQSINELYLKQPETVAAEIEQLKSETDIPEGVDEREYLHRLWVYRAIKKTGGLVIFPHPYWFVKKTRWHISPRMAEVIMKNGLCDAFEIIGGGTRENNNMQVALYCEMLSQGVRLPVVGSTDCHSVLSPDYPFAAASTFVFTETGDIQQAVAQGLCVAAEHPYDEPIRLYGPYRLVRYARFLADYYFPLHSSLCACSGKLIVDYIHGDDSLKPLIEALEKRVRQHEKGFFGR